MNEDLGKGMKKKVKKREIKKRIWVVIIMIVLLVIDQGIKIYANINLQENSIVWIQNIMQLSYWKSMDAAMELVKDNLFFILLLNILVIAFIIRFLIVQFTRMSIGTKIGLSFIIAGGFSNLIDRLLFGGVINYIDITPMVQSFPIFNLADIYILIGLLIFIVAFAVYNVKQTIQAKKEKL